MNYEKEYKKLKADIEKAYLFAQTDSTKSVLEHILPELRESEDERIRKEIIDFLQLPHPQFVGERKQEKWITWLEKQGENPICKVKIGERYKCIASPRYTCFFIGDIYEVTDDFIAKLINLCSDCFILLEKQGGKKETLCDKCRKEQPSHSCQDITSLGRCAIENQEEPQVYEIEDGKVITYSETGGYKVIEPKFKVGDWIVFNGLTLYIKEVVKGYYRTISKGDIPNSYDWAIDIDNIARLWTIQDAKDGDVLEFGDHGRLLVGIVSYVNKTTGKVDVYCLLENNSFKVGNYYNLDTIKPHPATKEQCDLLFRKMMKSGYEWDDENKELKHIY